MEMKKRTGWKIEFSLTNHDVSLHGMSRIYSGKQEQALANLARSLYREAPGLHFTVHEIEKFEFEEE